MEIFLTGDVMLGRGVDQAMAVACDPRLYEGYVKDARDYLRLAERASGAIPKPLPSAYVWGDLLGPMTRSDVDLRVINLETSITTSGDHWPGKGIHYRMHPANVKCLAAAHIDCCCLANNHVLDWGYAGLAETIATLDRAGIAHAGAGANAEEAAAPAILNVPGKGRVRVYAYGTPSAGVPKEWAATKSRAGINYLPEISKAAAQHVVAHIGERRGEMIVVAVHWGGNWGYKIPSEQIEFAHHLMAEGVSVVHGHSSHHPKGAELYRHGLALYGCGDLLNDYEGISGEEEYRGDLVAGYLVSAAPAAWKVVRMRAMPMRIARLRLNRPSMVDTEWLRHLLEELCAPLNTRVELAADGGLEFKAVEAAGGE